MAYAGALPTALPQAAYQCVSARRTAGVASCSQAVQQAWASRCSMRGFSSSSSSGSSSRGSGPTRWGWQVVSLFGFGSNSSGPSNDGGTGDLLKWARRAKAGTQLAPATAPDGQEIATFAGGCFWGLELAYQRVPGVTRTSVGYTQGVAPNPTYEQVCSGRTGHTEAVQVYYDPAETSYEQLLDTFFAHVDPTTLNRQGGDAGTQYRSGIYYHNERQKEAAEKAIARVNDQLASNVFRRVLGTRVVSELLPAGDYYLAEAYHQQYLARGGRFNRPQSADKGATDKIRCYG